MKIYLFLLTINIPNYSSINGVSPLIIHIICFNIIHRTTPQNRHFISSNTKQNSKLTYKCKDNQDLSSPVKLIFNHKPFNLDCSTKQELKVDTYRSYTIEKACNIYGVEHGTFTQTDRQIYVAGNCKDNTRTK